MNTRHQRLLEESEIEISRLSASDKYSIKYLGCHNFGQQAELARIETKRYKRFVIEVLLRYMRVSLTTPSIFW